ncbi:MAG: DUF6587 family protein [Steroidobacteraceae bacterium]|jgi:hypothetical protein
MNSILDGTLVSLALLVSAGYALTSLGPQSFRRRILALLSRAAAHAPPFLGLRRTAQRLDAAALKAPGACGGCDSCGSEQTPAQKPRGADVSVPVAKIGRRARSSVPRA